MKLFGKKKSFGRAQDLQEEELDHELESVRGKKKPKTKDFKDLNPENKKKRKEPPKPWGKKERLFVLTVIVLTTGTSAFLSLSARDWKLPGFPRLTAPSLNLPPLGEKTFVIEGNKKDLEKSEKAQTLFREKTYNLSGVYGFYVIRLKNGSSYGLFENDEFQAASLIKLPVMASAFIAAEEGELDLDEEYVLRNEDKVGGAGSLATRAEGFRITYRELIRLMGKESDNTAFKVLRNKLGEENIEAVVAAIGMINTSLGENLTTPYDVGRFFAEVWKGNVLSSEARDELFDYLTDTAYESWLAAGVPSGIEVAHKYGREVNVINDAGIVFTEDPFVLVLMSKGIVDKEGDGVFPELSNILYKIETEKLITE